MDWIKLYRVGLGHVTFSRIFVNGFDCGYGLELPWKNNEKSVSCILPGKYYFEVYRSKKYKRDCIKLFDVFGRTYICIHPGNSVTETKGCILPGQYISRDRLVSSNNALDRILSLLVEDQGMIEIF